MKYYLRTQNNEVTQVWMCEDEITTPAQVKTATCEIFIIKQVSKEIMDDMMNVPFKALQEIDKEAFLLICNQKNLLAITSCNSLAGCHISF
jgi:hypothetical protein